MEDFSSAAVSFCELQINFLLPHEYKSVRAAAPSTALLPSNFPDPLRYFTPGENAGESPAALNRQPRKMNTGGELQHVCSLTATSSITEVLD